MHSTTLFASEVADVSLRAAIELDRLVRGLEWRDSAVTALGVKLVEWLDDPGAWTILRHAIGTRWRSVDDSRAEIMALQRRCYSPESYDLRELRDLAVTIAAEAMRA